MFSFNKKSLIMGILNVTPDSFSDGGKYFKIENAIKHAEELIKSGIDIIDIGGESTRPGAMPVSEKEELRRIVPIVKWRRDVVHNVSTAQIVISIDTYKSNVAQKCLETGADMINDVSGLTMDAEMVKVAAKYNCPIVIMHNRGIPATKPENVTRHCEEQSNEAISKTLGRLPRRDFVPPRNDIVSKICSWLKNQTDYAIKNDVKKENIIIDPGIGFGKTPEEDLFIIENLQGLKSLGYPILVGPSRKSFIKKLFPDSDIDIKSKEIINLAIENGADIVRIH